MHSSQTQPTGAPGRHSDLTRSTPESARPCERSIKLRSLRRHASLFNSDRSTKAAGQMLSAGADGAHAGAGYRRTQETSPKRSVARKNVCVLDPSIWPNRMFSVGRKSASDWSILQWIGVKNMYTTLSSACDLWTVHGPPWHGRTSTDRDKGIVLRRDAKGSTRGRKEMHIHSSCIMLSLNWTPPSLVIPCACVLATADATSFRKERCLKYTKEPHDNKQHIVTQTSHVAA
jgi:hypothetical protein